MPAMIILVAPVKPSVMQKKRINTVAIIILHGGVQRIFAKQSTDLWQANRVLVMAIIVVAPLHKQFITGYQTVLERLAQIILATRSTRSTGPSTNTIATAAAAATTLCVSRRRKGCAK